MFIAAHLLAGLFIGMFTGDYLVAVVTSVAIDLDHIFSYIRSGVLFNPSKLIDTLTSSKDERGDQRSFLHFGFVWILLSVLAYWFFYDWAYVFSISYFVHLLLDMLDGSPYFPFYPFYDKNVEGPLGYISGISIFLTTIGFIVYFSLLYY